MALLNPGYGDPVEEFKAKIDEAQNLHGRDVIASLLEYIIENEREGWPSYTGRDTYAVRKFLKDFGLYITT